MPATPAAGPGAGLVFTGVAMEVSADDRPSGLVGGLTLRISAEGIGVDGLGRSGGGDGTVPWARVRGARCGEPGFLEDGAPAIAISAVVGGRLVRWLVPSDQLPPDRATAVDTLLVARSAVDRPPPYWSPEPLDGGPAPPAPGPTTPTPGPTNADPTNDAGAAPASADAETPPPPGDRAPDDRAPAGPAPPTDAVPAGRTARTPSERMLLAALWVLLLLLVALAVILGIGLARPSSPSSAPGPSRSSSDRPPAVELDSAKSAAPCPQARAVRSPGTKRAAASRRA